MKIIKELTFIGKKNWGEGPWQNEPDKIQMLDEETDLDCLIVRAPHGALCGYVGIDKNHPLYEKEYSDDSVDLEVHGGLTFSRFCVEDEKEHGICHTPLPGRPDKVWWFGFDCAHAFDLCPQYSQQFKPIPGEQYRDVNYVKNECAKLAKQLNERKIKQCKNQ